MGGGVRIYVYASRKDKRKMENNTGKHTQQRGNKREKWVSGEYILLFFAREENIFEKGQGKCPVYLSKMRNWSYGKKRKIINK
jgi:hypothetical protein